MAVSDRCIVCGFYQSSVYPEPGNSPVVYTIHSRQAGMTSKHTIPAGLVQAGGIQNPLNTPAPPLLDSGLRLPLAGRRQTALIHLTGIKPEYRVDNDSYLS